MIGFLEEEAGVKSSTRLFGAILIALTAIEVLTMCVYVFLLRTTASAAVFGALVGGISATCAQGAVAISKRNGPSDPR